MEYTSKSVLRRLSSMIPCDNCKAVAQYSIHGKCNMCGHQQFKQVKKQEEQEATDTTITSE
jgi:rRNA maturation endonuclease Nob1